MITKGEHTLLLLFSAEIYFRATNQLQSRASFVLHAFSEARIARIIDNNARYARVKNVSTHILRHIATRALDT